MNTFINYQLEMRKILHYHRRKKSNVDYAGVQL